MGLTGMTFSTIAFAAGAVMYWAITTQGHGFKINTVGVILMIVGGIGFFASSVVFATSRLGTHAKPRTFDRQVIDGQGRSSEVHEEIH